MSDAFVRRHIVLVTSALFGGGAEQVLVTMADYWAVKGHRITVVTLRADPLPEYRLSPLVEIVRLQIISATNPFWKLSHVRRLVQLRRGLVNLHPNFVISFLDKLNATVLLALVGTRIPVIATEHLAPWMNPLGFCWELLRKITYRRAAAVVSPTEAITQWFKKTMRGNYVTLQSPSRSIPDLANSVRRPVILGIGRLVSQKGFDILIKAFADIAQRHPLWNLEIAGEGPDRAQLERQIAAENLEKRVLLLGYVNDLTPLYRSSEIFALSSRHEAYPMVLCEAISSGCCVIATDCPTGPREILENGRAGMLVSAEDPGMLAKGLEKLVSNEGLRHRLQDGANRRRSELSYERVMPNWDEALAYWTGFKQ